MKPTMLFLLTVLSLASCAAPTIPAQAPTPTATPVPTSTPTLPPTATPSPTPEAWVAIAEEYGMPPEQAQKLDGMNVTFERWTKNVDGVLVKNEAGKDAFWYDPQTEFLVAVDRWKEVKDIDRIKENQLTETELFSDEYFAWLKYLSSKIDFDPNKINNVGLIEFSAAGTTNYLGYDISNLPNFEVAGISNEERNPLSPQERNPGGLGTLVVKNVEGPLTDFVTLPVVMFDVNTQIAYPVKLVLRASSEAMPNQLKLWKEKMNICISHRKLGQ